MRQFIYKVLVVIIAVVLVYEFTIGKQVALFKDRADMLISKEGRRDGVNKLRNEVKKAIETPGLIVSTLVLIYISHLPRSRMLT